VNAVKGIAAGFVILVLVLALIAGLSSGQGREVFDNIVAAGQTTLNWTADQIGNLSNLLRTRGNSFRALIAGVVVFAGLVLLVPYFRKSPTSILILGVIAALSAWVLYDPTILPSA
jgi:peptidoglycan/LPS O-acetylase OafA/YrhL